MLTPESSEFTMSVTSSQALKRQPIDVDRDTINRMLADAYLNYNRAFSEGDNARAMWWDGGIRHLHWILEAGDH